MKFDKEMLQPLFDMLVPMIIERIVEEPSTTQTRVVLLQYEKHEGCEAPFVDIPSDLGEGWKLCSVKHDTRAVSAMYTREVRAERIDAEFSDDEPGVTHARCAKCRATYVVSLPGQDRCDGCLDAEKDPRGDAGQAPG